MNPFKVIDPKGIHLDGKHHEKGAKASIPDGAVLDAFLHFKQVEPAKTKAEDPKPEPDADAKK